MSDAQIAAAEARAKRARERLADALGALKHRLLPGTIARQLVGGVSEKGADAARAGADAVKARPGIAVGVAALAALVLARKPIARAFSGDDATDDETDADPARSSDNS